MGLRNYLNKVNRYFWFSKSEWNGIVIVALAFGLISSWDKWGATSFDYSVGLTNLLVAVLAAFLVVITHHAAQRFMGLRVGLLVEHKLWLSGLIVGLILVLVSNGFIKFFAATTTATSMLYSHRLGKKHYGPNLWTIAKVVIAGPIANIVLAALAHLSKVYGIIPGFIATPIFTLSLAFAIYNLLPIPGLDGAHILYFSRPLWVFLFSVVVSFALFASIFKVFSLVLAIIVGGFLGFLFYWHLERSWRN